MISIKHLWLKQWNFMWISVKYWLWNRKIHQLIPLTNNMLSWTMIVVHNRDHPFLHIIIIIHIIIFLFCTASMNLIAYFPLKLSLALLDYFFSLSLDRWKEVWWTAYTIFVLQIINPKKWGFVGQKWYRLFTRPFFRLPKDKRKKAV